MTSKVKTEFPYFQVPNSIFDIGIMVYDPGGEQKEKRQLRASEKLVYIFLCRCGNNGGQAFPSYQTIADRCGISKRKAIDVITVLTANELIKKETRPKSNRDNETNIYIIIPPSATIAPPSELSAPGVVQPLHQPSATIAPRKRTTEKEPIEEEIDIKNQEEEPVSFSLFNSLLGIWTRQYQMKIGKEAKPTEEELILLKNVADSGVSEMEFQGQVKGYFAKKRFKYRLGELLEAG